MKETINDMDKRKLIQALNVLGFPEWLVKEKGESFEKFKESPIERDPLYAKYVDEDLFNTENVVIHLDTSEARIDLLSEELKTEIEHLPAVIISIDGKLVFSKLPEEWKSKGVQVLEGKNIFSLNHEGVKKILDEINSEVGLNKFVAMNHAFNIYPLLIYIPDNVRLETPLIKIDLDISSVRSVFNQTLILLGKQSELILIRELHSIPFERQELGFWNDLVAIHVGDGSILKTGFMNALSENSVLVGQVITHTENNASIEWLSNQLGSKAEFWKNYFYLDGEGSQLSNYECVFGDKDQNITLVTRMQHLAPHTIGRTFNRGVVKDNASISSIGIATVFNQAPFSDSNLVESSLIVGDNASANSFPFLEIDTSEVKAGHSASTSKLDEDLVFYVMSRGLPRDRTENILIRGYLEPTIQRHSSPEVRKVAHLLVQNKWDEKLGKIMSTKIFEEEEE